MVKIRAKANNTPNMAKSTLLWAKATSKSELHRKKTCRPSDESMRWLRSSSRKLAAFLGRSSGCIARACRTACSVLRVMTGLISRSEIGLSGWRNRSLASRGGCKVNR